jgi:hypothetical protein
MALANPAPPFPEGPEALAMAQAGLRALVRMADLWGLSVEQQRKLLGDLPKTTYYGLLKGSVRTVSRDTLERLSLLMGIWANLEILIPQAEAATGWLRRPHPGHSFAGQAPLDWMLQGRVASLVDVRRHLEAWRFGW